MVYFINLLIVMRWFIDLLCSHKYDNELRGRPFVECMLNTKSQVILIRNDQFVSLCSAVVFN